MKSYTLLFTRLLLGIVLFWQGYGKVFNWTVDGVYASGFASYQDTFLPTFLLKFTAYFTSYGELIAGVLLVLGLLRKVSYATVALILLIVSFGHGLQTPIWDMQHVLIRTALLVFIAWNYREDTVHLDRFIFKQ